MTPHLDITPAQALVDVVVTIRINDCAPRQPITLRAQMRDDFGRGFHSHATFTADAQGVVNVAAQKPLSGTYDSVDPMGLFWSLTLDKLPNQGAFFTKTGLTPTTITLTAEIDGKPAASPLSSKYTLRLM